MKLLRCRFGCLDPVHGLYFFPLGCVCYRTDQLQALCYQHVLTAEPIGAMWAVWERPT